METKNIVGFDTETFPIENGKKAPKVVCLTYDDGGEAKLVAGAEVEQTMHSLLSSSALLVGQNVAYDAACLSATFPSLVGPIWGAYEKARLHSVDLRDRLIDLAKGIPRRPKGWYALDGIAWRRLKLKLDKENPWRVRFGELEGIPVEDWPKEAREYALTDATAPLQIFKSQAQEAVEFGYEGFENEAARQCSFDFPLFLMQCWGVRSHTGRVRELSRKTKFRITELKAKLISEGLVTPEGKQIMSAIRERVAEALDDAPKTATGLIKTNKWTMEKCHDQLLDEVQELKNMIKLDSTYIDKLWEGTAGNIHARFHVLGAATGRTSSSQPNLQNQPRVGGARECFTARPGHVFILCDYDSQELRTLAQVCVELLGHSKLAAKYKEDPEFDPHTSFAAQLMGWSYEEAMERKAAGDKEVKKRRQEAKAANFGFPGGMGAKGFRTYARNYGVNITLQEAYKLRASWFKQWPETQRYFACIKATVQDDEGLIRHIKSKRLRGGAGFCDGANSLFQGLASEASKTAAFRVSRKCYADPDSPLFDCRPVMLVHDELIVEAPEDRAHEAAQAVQVEMEAAMAIWCPDVPARATPALCRYWTKDASPVYVDGRLVPWEPDDEEGRDPRPDDKPVAEPEGRPLGGGDLLEGFISGCPEVIDCSGARA